MADCRRQDGGLPPSRQCFSPTSCTSRRSATVRMPDSTASPIRDLTAQALIQDRRLRDASDPPLDLLICWTVVDTISPERRSENMRRIRSKGMTPEILVRRLLHQMGYRYRLHRKSLPGHPDIIFPKLKKAIFVHGCFWHQHSDPTCKVTRLPKSRLEYWRPKLARNKQRDSESLALLLQHGWKVQVVWECQVADRAHLKSELVTFLDG